MPTGTSPTLRLRGELRSCHWVPTGSGAVGTTRYERLFQVVMSHPARLCPPYETHAGSFAFSPAITPFMNFTNTRTISSSYGAQSGNGISGTS